jgi:hypothetical protein
MFTITLNYTESIPRQLLFHYPDQLPLLHARGCRLEPLSKFWQRQRCREGNRFNHGEDARRP